MQFRGPAENGMYAYGENFSITSLVFENRSGSNLSGSGKTFGSLLIAIINIVKSVPLRII